MVTIIDYNTGNLGSIRNLIGKLGFDATISNDLDAIRNASKLILPGVGHFDYGMMKLRELGLIEVLSKKVVEEKTPILGICLGVQLFTRGSDEGKEPGLGWINAWTKAFDRSRINGLKIPHMGWSDLRINSGSKLFSGFTEIPRFYFVHSYHLQCENSADELAYCSHGYDFTAALEHDNIVGVQFHPEKSHRFGLHIMRNFINHY
ncbi:MAG: imidazole glycerol phosphate synthase subunit HisH [Cyclobacteriaceae bacterium]